MLTSQTAYCHICKGLRQITGLSYLGPEPDSPTAILARASLVCRHRSEIVTSYRLYRDLGEAA